LQGIREVGGGWRVRDADWGMCHTRQPEQAGLFAAGDYAVGKVATNLAGAQRRR
jgi:hypothetical protein